MLINIKSFSGATPILSPRLLPDYAGQTAKNCQTKRGSLETFKTTTIANTPSKVGTKKTIYLYNNLYWLHWLENVDVVKSPIAGDTTGLLYWTGEGAPKVSNATMITAGGGTNYPTTSYNLGIPVPGQTPSVAVAGASSDPTQAESRAYVYTYVSAWGEEGPPSAPSAIIAVEPSQSVNLTNLATVPTGSYNITQKRIYRTATGTTGTDYRYVATIAIASETYSDTTATANLGEAIPSTFWDAPPSNMHSLHLHPSGFMVGISGKDICFSVPYMPHAWPEAYRIPIDHNPVGLGIFGTSVLVLTDSRPYIISGTDPEYLTKENLEINQSCVSKRGIVDVGDAVAYPSPDGLILVGAGKTQNATDKIFSRDQWQALHPESMISAFHDGCYYGFSNGTGIFLDFTGNVKTIEISPTAVFQDTILDKLCLQVGSNIVLWNNGTTVFGTVTWKSKVFSLPKESPPPCVAQINAASYPVVLKIYADGTLKLTKSVTSGGVFRIAGGYTAQEYEFQIESNFEVFSFTAASSIAVLKTAL